MTKQLFTVTIEAELVVVADDEVSAVRQALDARRDLGDHDFDAAATPMQHWPAGWEEGCIPFGEGDASDTDRTVGGWITAGAAPFLAQTTTKEGD